MASLVSKAAQREIALFSQKLLPSPGKVIPEDLMERGADLLEDDWSRTFFMTVCGFTRLLRLLLKGELADEITRRSIAWLEKRFPQAKDNPDLDRALRQFATLSLGPTNLNITFKRLTAILSKSDRAYLAQGLLEACAPDHVLSAEQHHAAQEILTQLLLSIQSGMEILENWKKSKSL